MVVLLLIGGVIVGPPVYTRRAGGRYRRGEALAEAQRQLRDQLAQSSQHEGERQRLLAAMHDKDTERERILTLFQRGRLTLDEAEARLEGITRGSADLRALLDGLSARAELARTWEARMTDAAVMLGQLRDTLAAIEANDDREAKRQIISLLVHQAAVQTHGDGRRKAATLTITYVFGPPRLINNSNEPITGRAGPTPGR